MIDLLRWSREAPTRWGKTLYVPRRVDFRGKRWAVGISGHAMLAIVSPRTRLTPTVDPSAAAILRLLDPPGRFAQVAGAAWKEWLNTPSRYSERGAESPPRDPGRVSTIWFDRAIVRHVVRAAPSPVEIVGLVCVDDAWLLHLHGSILRADPEWRGVVCGLTSSEWSPKYRGPSLRWKLRPMPGCAT